MLPNDGCVVLGSQRVRAWHVGVLRVHRGGRVGPAPLLSLSAWRRDTAGIGADPHRGGGGSGGAHGVDPCEATAPHTLAPRPAPPSYGCGYGEGATAFPHNITDLTYVVAQLHEQGMYAGLWTSTGMPYIVEEVGVAGTRVCKTDVGWYVCARVCVWGGRWRGGRAGGEGGGQRWQAPNFPSMTLGPAPRAPPQDRRGLQVRVRRCHAVRLWHRAILHRASIRVDSGGLGRHAPPRSFVVRGQLGEHGLRALADPVLQRRGLLRHGPRQRRRGWHLRRQPGVTGEEGVRECCSRARPSPATPVVAAASGQDCGGRRLAHTPPSRAPRTGARLSDQVDDDNAHGHVGVGQQSRQAGACSRRGRRGHATRVCALAGVGGELRRRRGQPPPPPLRPPPPSPGRGASRTRATTARR